MWSCESHPLHHWKIAISWSAEIRARYAHKDFALSSWQHDCPAWLFLVWKWTSCRTVCHLGTCTACWRIPNWAPKIYGIVTLWTCGQFSSHTHPLTVPITARMVPIRFDACRGNSSDYRAWQDEHGTNIFPAPVCREGQTTHFFTARIPKTSGSTNHFSRGGH